MHLGPYPVERLRRATSSAPIRLREPSTAPPAPGALGQIIRDYGELYLTTDTIPRENTRVTLPPPGQLANEIKATCHFLDASAVGICAVEGEPAGVHSAIVILVETGTVPESSSLVSAWLGPNLTEITRMRAAEIAVVLAGYIRQLGGEAHIRTGPASDPTLQDAAVASGIALKTSDDLHVPFVDADYTIAMVLTSLPLLPDKPLDPTRDPMTSRAHLSHLLGIGGVRSMLQRRALRRRPSHLGSYPMETIRRQPRPTTLIFEDEVPRVPKRANFFVRAGHGDLGPKTRRERDRFATKHPLAYAMRPLMRALVPLQDGPVAESTSVATGDAETNAKAVKSLGYLLGADIIGIGEAVPYAWYSHDEDGTPIPIRHRYAIVMLIDQGHDTSEGSSGDDWISGSQSMRAYLRGAEVAGVLAAQIRSLGYPARSHTNQKSDVLHIPLMLHAGLGELSRIGELVLNPFLGPRSKSVVVTTDMPLALDQPVDFGLQDFCSKCRKCARECPCNAITHKNKVIFNGYEMWKPDVERCTRYRVTNPKGSSCGRCMKVCPFANEGLVSHRMFLWLAIHVPFTRRFIIWLDDYLKHGSRNPRKRWWRDLTRTPAGPVDIATGTNERDLKLGLKTRVPQTQAIACYPADVMPHAEANDPWPVDRPRALETGASMETPSEALVRRGRRERSDS